MYRMTHQFQAQAETAVLIAEGGPGASRIDECHSLLLRESFGYLVSKIVPGFFGLISVPIFVRLIGVDEYGRLSMLLPILLALSGAGSGWLQQGILRFHPGVDESGNTPAKFDHAVFRGTTYSVLVLAAVMLPVLLVLHYSAVVWLIAELYCFVILPYLVWLSLLQAQLQPQAVIRNEALRSLRRFRLACPSGGGNRAAILLVGAFGACTWICASAGHQSETVRGHGPNEAYCSGCVSTRRSRSYIAGIVVLRMGGRALAHALPGSSGRRSIGNSTIFRLRSGGDLRVTVRNCGKVLLAICISSNAGRPPANYALLERRRICCGAKNYPPRGPDPGAAFRAR